jgi:hypothetical protein
VQPGAPVGPAQKEITMSITASDPFGGGVARPSQDSDRPSGRAVGTERRAGRRAISVSLLLIGVFAMVSGFWGLLLPRGSFALPVHVAAASVFGLLSLVHVRNNRNAIRLYLRDLGWSPAVLRLLLAAVIALVLLVPVIRLF